MPAATPIHALSARQDARCRLASMSWPGLWHHWTAARATIACFDAREALTLYDRAERTAAHSSLVAIAAEVARRVEEMAGLKAADVCAMLGEGR